ncbi:MAG: hypothetical protein ABGY41_07595, partial [Candidatus Poribacteria bacterium]
QGSDMRQPRAVCALTVAALLGCALNALADVEAGPGEAALFRRILAESDAYDVKWLNSYSAQYSSRWVERDASGEIVSSTTRAGLALAHGGFTSAQGTEVDHLSDRGETRDVHWVTDGSINVQKIGMKTLLSTGPGSGMREDPALPMMWMSLGKYWQATHPDIPLADLLTGETAPGTSMLLYGERVSTSERLTALSAREEKVDGRTLYRLSLTTTRTAGSSSHSGKTEFLLDPQKAYRMLRVTNHGGSESDPLIRAISLAQNDEGVWYPARVQLSPKPYTREAWVPPVGDPIPASEGTLTRTTDFTEFTTSPHIPDDAFAAIPAEGSVARNEVLQPARDALD